MGSGIPCLAGRFINDSLNVRCAKRRAAALTRLSTLELAPVLRFVCLFVYEKGRVHKHKSPRRKAVSEHSERTLETEGFPRWGVGVCARGGQVGKSASAREARRAERFSRRGSGTCGNTCSSALCIFSFIVLIIPKRLF